MDSSVDNFTITVSSLDSSTVIMTTVESPPLSNVILNYNTHYNISIRGRNCAGSSESTAIQYIECECQDNLSFTVCNFTASPSVGCPAPSEPVNGSVSGFTSASVGSEVTYHCNAGLTLVGESVAMCTSDLVWVPNGSEIKCQQLPPGICSEVYLCTLLDTLYKVLTTDCSEPNRTCQEEYFSRAAVAAITGVPCIVLSFTVGTLLGAFLHHLITRLRSKPQSQHQSQKSVPMYEDVENITSTGREGAAIEMKSNEAYGPVRQQEISTRPNQAYGHVQL